MHQPARAESGLSMNMGKYYHAQGESRIYLPPLNRLVKMVHISCHHTLDKQKECIELLWESEEKTEKSL